MTRTEARLESKLDEGRTVRSTFVGMFSVRLAGAIGVACRTLVFYGDTAEECSERYFTFNKSTRYRYELMSRRIKANVEDDYPTPFENEGTA